MNKKIDIKKDLLCGNVQSAADSWPETTYGGRSVLDDVYGAARVLEKWFDDKNYAYQEVYLGYIQATDTFIIGWDVWPLEDNEDDIEVCFSGAYLAFRIMNLMDGSIETIPTDDHRDGMPEIDYHGFYGKSGMYNEVKKLFPNIVDLRLD